MQGWQSYEDKHVRKSSNRQEKAYGFFADALVLGKLGDL
jgi:hypothetical protein